LFQNRAIASIQAKFYERKLKKMNKTTVTELKEAIVEAVAELDQSDGSRIGTSEAIDNARSILETAYGDDLTEDVQDFLGIGSDSDDDNND
jgi:hypothetical protein